MIWKIANSVMLLLFAFAAVVQVNDPDPFAWILIYGLAVVACVLALLRRGHWLVPASIAALAVIWAAAISPRVLGQVPFTDMFGAFEMRDIGIEQSREMYGLLLVAVWLTVLAVSARRRAGARWRRP
ncbi:MAG: transmembrane 220 family protein [Longimicrobiales bacterium]